MPAKTHGEADKTREYNVWQCMRGRCRRNLKGYEHVEVCKEWQSYEIFLKDMGRAPEGATLDRIDPCGNYEPSNCRWASRSIQSRNRRPYGKSRHRGVYKQKGRWKVQLFLGTYETEEEAAAVADRARCILGLGAKHAS
jgi:hypothetical protein